MTGSLYRGRRSGTESIERQNQAEKVAIDLYIWFEESKGQTTERLSLPITDCPIISQCLPIVESPAISCPSPARVPLVQCRCRFIVLPFICTYGSVLDGAIVLLARILAFPPSRNLFYFWNARI